MTDKFLLVYWYLNFNVNSFSLYSSISDPMRLSAI